MNCRRSLISIAIIYSVFTAVNGVVFAQTSAISPLITWHADTYIPAAYEGRALPSHGANITAALTAFSNGLPISFTNQNIEWYANSSLIGGGTGKTQISFPMNISAESSLRLEARVPNYPGGGLVSNIFLPVTAPRIVIDTPYPYRKFPGGAFDLTAVPYFFTSPDISSANIAWSVNSKMMEAGSNPFFLHYQSAATRWIEVAANAQIGGESASANVFLTPQ